MVAVGDVGPVMPARWERGVSRVAAFLAARGVARASATLAASIVSAMAGLVLAAGGAAGEPRLWLLVPSLGLARLALFAVETRLVDCPPAVRRPEESFDGQR
jgi:hypothetical protein